MRMKEAVVNMGVPANRVETLVMQWLKQNPAPSVVEEVGIHLKQYRPRIHAKVRDKLREIVPYHDEQ